MLKQLEYVNNNLNQMYGFDCYFAQNWDAIAKEISILITSAWVKLQVKLQVCIIL